MAGRDEKCLMSDYGNTAAGYSSAILPSNAIAATDGTYNMFQVQSAWDGADASRTASTTDNYDYSYDDEGSVSFALPWTFSFY